MKKNNKPVTPEQKAYSRGYTAGRNSNKKSGEKVIAALQQQSEYWRNRYLRLRDFGELAHADDSIARPAVEPREEPTR
jgi:hypothetical protein